MIHRVQEAHLGLSLLQTGGLGVGAVGSYYLIRPVLVLDDAGWHLFAAFAALATFAALTAFFLSHVSLLTDNQTSNKECCQI